MGPPAAGHVFTMAPEVRLANDSESDAGEVGDDDEDSPNHNSSESAGDRHAYKLVLFATPEILESPAAQGT